MPVLQLLPPDVADEVKICLDGVAPQPRRVVRRAAAVAIDLYRNGTGDAGSLHAVGAAIFAAVGARVPVTYTPNVAPTAGELRAARWLRRRGDVRGLALTRHAARDMERSGAFSAVVHQPLRARPSGAASVRSRFPVSAGDRVVLALGDSTREDDHVLALWAMGILAFADPSWRLLISGRGPKVDRVRRFALGSGLPETVIFAEEHVAGVGEEALLASCDYAACTASEVADAGPLARAIAAGKPIVAVDSPQAVELLPRECVLHRPTPRQLAQRIMDLDASRHA